MTRIRVTVDVDRFDDHLFLRWTTPRSSGEARFDHVPGTRPAWLAAEDDLLGDTDRRTADAVLDAVARWAADASLEMGVWHEGGGVEVLDI